MSVHASKAIQAGDAHVELVESLDQQVREAVRRDGVDPQRQPSVVRQLAEAVVRAHDDRSLTGAVAPVTDVDTMVGELVARVSGLGPLQPFLDDPTVEEIWINSSSHASCEVRRPLIPLSPHTVRRIAESGRDQAS